MISVIIPVYNAEKSLSRCLDSILAQSYDDFEILLIDDGSKDSSPDIILEYEKKYPSKIKAIIKANEGVAKTRNMGINLAKGDYIAFVDNDDFLNRDYFDVLIENIGNNDIIISGYRRASLEKEFFTLHAIDAPWTKYLITAPWARLYNKDFLLDNKIEFYSSSIGEDVYFNLDAYSKTDKIKILDYIGYNWYYNEESVSNTSQRGLEEVEQVINLLNKVYLLYENKNDLVNYFYVRYVVWYLLFSGKAASKDQFIIVSKQLFKWLKMHDIHNKYKLLSSDIASDPLKNRIAVMFMPYICNSKLINIFTTIYCK